MHSGINDTVEFFIPSVMYGIMSCFYFCKEWYGGQLTNEVVPVGVLSSMFWFWMLGRANTWVPSIRGFSVHFLCHEAMLGNHVLCVFEKILTSSQESRLGMTRKVGVNCLRNYSCLSGWDVRTGIKYTSRFCYDRLVHDLYFSWCYFFSFVKL